MFRYTAGGALAEDLDYAVAKKLLPSFTLFPISLKMTELMGALLLKVSRTTLVSVRTRFSSSGENWSVLEEDYKRT